MLVWSRTPTNSMSSWARTWLTASLYTVMILKYSSSKASSEILPDIIVVSGVNHATSYLFYIWWSSQSRWFKVCRLAKESVEPTAYCLLPQSLTCYGLKCRTYWMSTTPSLLNAVPSATTFLTFYLLSGVKYLMWWASKLPSNSHRVWIACPTLKQ